MGVLELETWFLIPSDVGSQGNTMFLEMIGYGPMCWGDLEHVFSFWLPSCVIDHSSHYCLSTHDFKLHKSYPRTIII